MTGQIKLPLIENFEYICVLPFKFNFNQIKI